MPSTYSPLKIELMSTGENTTTWGDVTNVNLGTAIEEAIVGSADVAFSNANVTLTLTNTNSAQVARNLRLNLTGTATAGYNLVVPAIEKPYIINNATDGTITVKNATGTGVAVPAGKTMWVYNNATNVVDVATHLSSLTLGTPLAVAQGGTGATTSTGSGAVVLATSPTLVTPNLGTPSAATLTNATGLPIVAGTTGTLSVARGGTGATSLTAGYLVKGNGTSAASASVVYDDGTNVGVNTNTPSSKFAVFGGASGTDTRITVGNAASAFQFGVGSANETLLVGNAPFPMLFYTDSVERMRIDSAGNVLIGTTSGAFKLDVPNNVVHFLETVVGSDALGWGRFVTASNTFFIQSGSLNSGSSASRDFAFTNMYGTGEILRLLASGGITSANLADAVGYKGLPQNSRTASYTLALSDMGKHISITTGGVVIPDNGSVAFPVGATVVIYNNSASTQTISILPTDTLRLAGTATTGSRTLAQRGLATCVKVAAGEWVVSGNVT
jgi:hypothetical protein